jgi:hypothetical protein
MDYGFNFVADRIVRDKAYPAAARHQAEPYTPAWREFGRHYPFTVPVDLHDHCFSHGMPARLYAVNDEFPANSFYTIGISFFNFSIDYIDLLPVIVKQHLQSDQLKILFYYDEGDNPFVIKQYLDNLCVKHNLSTDCYKFISANTVANCIDNFAYFPGDELLFWQRNQQINPINQHDQPRPYQFTVLSRTHKWWRATVMTDLQQSGILKNSQFSYRIDIDCNDNPLDNPIEIDQLDNVRQSIDEFLQNSPYICDDFDVDKQNDHHLIVSKHYTDSYCSVILETHFDADGSGGAFLTEKTFRAIKHGHPFVIAGCAGSLTTLRNLGYRTFDHVIDNSYDTVVDNTQRWIRCRAAIAEIQQQDMLSWFESCRSDIEHNQQLFAQHKTDRLNTLLKRLQHI